MVILHVNLARPTDAQQFGQTSVELLLGFLCVCVCFKIKFTFKSGGHQRLTSAIYGRRDTAPGAGPSMMG